MKAHSVFKSEERFPVYCKYPQQFRPQPAYITLDIRTGEIDADYSGEIGGGMSFDVFHNIVIRAPINPETTADQITEIINDNLDLFQKILDASEVVWDGSNYVGRTDYELYELTEIGFQRYEGGIINLAEWIQNDPFPADGVTVEQFAQEALDSEDNGYYFLREMTVDEMLSDLRSIWADMLYSGKDIPKAVAQYLLETGECDDSQWMDELKEFANQ